MKLPGAFSPGHGKKLLKAIDLALERGHISKFAHADLTRDVKRTMKEMGRR